MSEKVSQEDGITKAESAGASAFAAFVAIVLLFITAAAVFLTIGFFLQANWVFGILGVVAIAALLFVLGRLMRAAAH